MRRSPRRGGLPTRQQAANFVIPTVRPRIGPVFGKLKPAYALARAPCSSLVRSAADATIEALAWNLRRAVTLLQHVA